MSLLNPSVLHIPVPFPFPAAMFQKNLYRNISVLLMLLFASSLLISVKCLINAQKIQMGPE